ncbi:DUF4976 domain-containing protein [Paenibacillus antri]|uniref:DUF4976 domain-containing protein n=1 Tax=Paenibacillus antri TaxID=2582848 RepID=A0A5R9GK34_9BACL|nr:sulfatase-like hydrolase/transferase [Paenibacillus antri]TLS53808.1 DUF4976 domain-containing protein [Paenibacillus antri]
MNKPHIVLFNPDQWRGDVLGHRGNAAAVTPNLDAMVRTDAVSFSHAFCQSPVCTPSRCSFMSGWYPHVRGHRTMHHMMKPDEPVLLRRLKEEGYFVWWAGKNDLVSADAGVDSVCDIRYRSPRDKAPDLHVDQSWRCEAGMSGYYSFFAGKLEASEGKDVRYDGDWAAIDGAIERIANRPKDRPLCLYLALGYPHPPYGVEEPWYGGIDRGKLPPRIAEADGKPAMLTGIRALQGLQDWNEERWRELRAAYYGMCARVDAQFGMLVAALKVAGIYDETAIFFFSDHGDYTGDYGVVEKAQNMFEDCLVRVPFIVKPPSAVPVEPGVNDALVELIDMPATVEALADIRPKHTHFGRSLLPLLAGDRKDHRDAVFCEGGRLREEAHARETESATDDSDLYWPRLSVQVHDDIAHGKAVMCRTRRYKYIRRLYEQDELYDMLEDPAEVRNRIDDPSLQSVLVELKDRMLTFLLETGDAVPHRPDPRRG